MKRPTRFSIEQGWKIVLSDFGLNPADVLKLAQLPRRPVCTQGCLGDRAGVFPAVAGAGVHRRGGRPALARWTIAVAGDVLTRYICQHLQSKFELGTRTFEPVQDPRWADGVEHRCPSAAHVRDLRLLWQ